jgi:hypothetical protein
MALALISLCAPWAGGDPRWCSFGLAVWRCDLQGNRDPAPAQSYGKTFEPD